MSQIEKTLNDKRNDDLPKILPMLPVRDVVVFPSMVLPIAVGREKSIRALEEAMTSERYIFVATQKNLQIEDPSPDDIYSIGSVCEVLQMLKMPDGTLKILIECVARAEWTEFKLTDKGYIEVGLNIFDENIEKTLSGFVAGDHISEVDAEKLNEIFGMNKDQITVQAAVGER